MPLKPSLTFGRPMISRIAFLLMLTLFMIGDLTAQSDTDQSPKLQVGDAIVVTVWRRPELSGEFQVGGGGEISHPLMKSVIVAGKDAETIQRELRSFLGSLDEDPQFSVQLLLRVTVSGEVRTPNLYRLPPETSVAEAVAMAGGGGERAKLNKVLVFRGNSQFVVDLTDPSSDIANQSIESGDRIVVERRTFVLRDLVAPTASVLGALISLANILTR